MSAFEQLAAFEQLDEFVIHAMETEKYLDAGIVRGYKIWRSNDYHGKNKIWVAKNRMMYRDGDLSKFLPYLEVAITGNVVMEANYKTRMKELFVNEHGPETTCIFIDVAGMYNFNM